MSGLLLDTCTISKFNSTTADVPGRLKALGDPDTYLSVISIGEFLCGHASSGNTDEVKKRKFREFLVREFGDRIIAVEEADAAEYGTFRAMIIETYPPKDGWKKKRRVERCMDITGIDLEIDDNDLWIVSQASAHNLTLITMDKMTRLRETFDDLVSIIYWPEDPTLPAIYSTAAKRLYGI